METIKRAEMVGDEGNHLRELGEINQFYAKSPSTEPGVRRKTDLRRGNRIIWGMESMGSQKTVLVTGATDGIGLELAVALVTQGHRVLIHGRSESKLEAASERLASLGGEGTCETFLADLSRMDQVDALAAAVAARHASLDALINNAGVFKVADPTTPDGLDVRFVVNTLAPFRLMQQLQPLLGKESRVVNLSSAAQAPVDMAALAGRRRLRDDFDAYAQSKLALTMWSHHLGAAQSTDGPAIIAVNPGSLLATKMVKEGFGTPGNDIGIGVDVLVRAALSDEFAAASGRYFDNDAGQFAPPHPDATDAQKTAVLVQTVEAMLNDIA